MARDKTHLRSEIALLVQALHTLQRGFVRPIERKIAVLRRQLYGAETVKSKREMFRFTKRIATRLMRKPSPDVATSSFARWTPREDAIVRANRRSPAESLSVKLGRTVRSVEQRRAKVCKKSK